MHGYYVIVAYNGPHNEFNSNFNEETKAGLSSFFCQARLFYNFIIFEPLLCERFTLCSHYPIVTYFCGNLILKIKHANLADLNFMIWQKKYNKGTTFSEKLSK